MTTLIGSRCTRSNAFSRGVLISRFLLGNVVITYFAGSEIYVLKKICILHDSCVLRFGSKLVQAGRVYPRPERFHLGAPLRIIFFGAKQGT